MQLIRQLALHPLFRHLSSTEMEKLLATENQRLTNYARGVVIYLQNELCHTLDLILAGTITVQSIDKAGNILTVSEFERDELVGLNLLFSQRNFYPMTIIAKTEAAVLHIQKAAITDICMHNQDFLLQLLQHLSDRSVFLTDKIKLISTKSIRQLIVEFLTYEYYRQNSSIVMLPMSKKELAERFGIPRTSLARELRKMRQAGLIEYDRHHIRIADLSLIEK